MKQNLQFNKLLKGVIIVGDLCLMNILFVALYWIFDEGTLGSLFVHSLPQILVLLNLVYLICNYNHGVILYRRIVRPDHIVRRAARNVLLHALVFAPFSTWPTSAPSRSAISLRSMQPSSSVWQPIASRSARCSSGTAATAETPAPSF